MRFNGEISHRNDQEENPQQQKLVVGYALTSKKTKSFLQPKLEGLARKKGILFVAIDQNRPLSDQGPFDIVLHKLTGREWRQILEDYRQNHPEVTVLDPPDAIQHVHNRQSMLQDVADLNLSDCYGKVCVPKQLVITKDPSSIPDAVIKAGLTLPLVAKPLVVDGSAKSHELSLAYDQFSLSKLEPPLVLQEFVNHGVRQRRAAATRDGWKLNKAWIRALENYHGHEDRSAWKLLGYEPRYRGYRTKKHTARRSQAAAEVEGEGSAARSGDRTASNSEASTSGSEDDAETIGRIVLSSESEPEGEMDGTRPKPVFKNLRAQPAGGRGRGAASSSRAPSSSSAPSSSTPPPLRTLPPHPAAGPSTSVVAPPPASRGEDLARKRARVEGSAGESSSGVSTRATPALWRPSFMLQPGRPMTVEDRLSGGPLVVASLGSACALPRDMEKHDELDDISLLASQMKAGLNIVQMAQVSVSRIQKCHEELRRMQANCDQHRKALEDGKAREKEYEETHQALFSELDKAKSAFELVKRREAELERRVAGLERQKAELEYRVQAEVAKAFQDGVDVAGEEYSAQVDDIRASSWEMGWMAALAKAGVPRDHPAYVSPDEFPRLEADTTPAANPEGDLPAAPGPEAALPTEVPLAVASSEIPPAAVIPPADPNALPPAA